MEVDDPFIALGIQMTVDGTRPEVIDEVMRAEIAAMGARHREGKRLLQLVGRCGPAFGMIATLLGLVLMLGNLSNPDSIGPSMAVALIGTLYGRIYSQSGVHSVHRKTDRSEVMRKPSPRKSFSAASSEFSRAITRKPCSRN